MVLTMPLPLLGHGYKSETIFKNHIDTIESNYYIFAFDGEERGTAKGRRLRVEGFK